MEALILRNCTFIPQLTEGYDAPRGDVLLAQGRIAALAPCQTAFDCPAEELDLCGATLMPGLIDMHVHLHWQHDSAWSTQMRDAWRVFPELRYASFLLDNGYTTVRDAGDSVSCASEAIRDAIRDGYVVGPRLICAGPTLNPGDVNSYTCEQNHYRFAGAEEMRRLVRHNITYGSDYIKLYGSGSLIAKGNDPNSRIIERDEIQEAVNVTGARGMYCAIHAHGSDVIDMAVRCGVRTIEHASFITEETLQYLDGRRDQGLVPTVGILHALANPSAGELSWNAKRVQGISARVFDCIRSAKRHDVLLGWGTDIALNVYEADPYIEMRTRKEDLGFSNLDILRQLTVDSARLLRLEEEIGTVKAGKCADLIAVDGDPAADIQALYSKPRHVFLAGRKIR